MTPEFTQVLFPDIWYLQRLANIKLFSSKEQTTTEPPQWHYKYLEIKRKHSRELVYISVCAKQQQEQQQQQQNDNGTESNHDSSNFKNNETAST